jgi:hypothetical protein
MLQHGLNEPGIKQVDASMSQRCASAGPAQRSTRHPSVPAKIISFAARLRDRAAQVLLFADTAICRSTHRREVIGWRSTLARMIRNHPGQAMVMGVTGEILGGASRDLGRSPAELIG